MVGAAQATAGPEPGPDEDRTLPSSALVYGGRYAIESELGRGGMARVLRAHDRKLDREVAVKVLAPGPHDEKQRMRFEQEARAAGALNHANIVAVYDVGEHAGEPYIVTELLEGETVRQLLASGPLAPDEALDLGLQLAEGLAAAHRKGIVHRDLKPDNLFVTGDGRLKIFDFGIARLLHAAQVRTETGSTVGTPAYMAPEQIRAEPVDARCDVFAFGCVLHELLAGQGPFEHESSVETEYAILHDPPAAPPPSVPAQLGRVIARCLEKDPARRYPDGAAILSELGGLRRRFELPSQLPRPVALPIAVALLVVAGVAVIAFLMRGRWRPGPPAPVPLQRLQGAGESRPAASPPAGTVAILPFDARDAPKFGYLAEGLIDLLARDLEGGALRAVDSASVLQALGGRVSDDVDKVRGASAQLRASYFLLGRIEERGRELAIEATLHAGDTGEAVGKASARGKPEDLLRLVRTLSDQVQSRPQPPRQFEARLASLARRTSLSPQALQAWLDGERLLRRGHWNEVVGAFQRATTADPEFALAHYRLGMVASVLDPGMAEDALQRALRYGDRLTRTERALAEARLAVQEGRLGEAERILLECTRRSPDDAESWMQLGEFYFHQNPLRARSPQEAEDAFAHVLTLDPLHAEAISHLADLAQMRGSRPLVSRLADRLLAISDDPTKVMSYGLAQAWARSDAVQHEKVLSALRAPGAGRQLLVSAFVRAEWQMDGFADAEAIAAQLAGANAAGERTLGHYLLGIVRLLRGQFDAARDEMGRASAIDPSGRATYVAPWLETLDFVPSSPERIEAARAAARRIVTAGNAYPEPARLHLLGALAARAGDWAAAEDAARELEKIGGFGGSSITGDLALAVRARVLAARHDDAVALALLEKQQLRIPARYSADMWHVAESRLRAALLESQGHLRDALALYDAVTFYSPLDPALVPAAHLRKARLLDTLGEHDGAMEHYSRFVELWKDCDPSGRPEVENARARLRELLAVRASR